MATGKPQRRAPIIEREYLDRMLDGLVEGKYHLLLGAGANDGVANRAGLLPFARELADLFRDEAGYPSSEQLTL